MMYARAAGLVTAVSALLFIATVTVWVRSYWHADVAALFINQDRTQAAGSFSGKVHFFFSDLPMGDDRAWSLDATTGTHDEFLSVRDRLFDTPALDRGSLGFRLLKGAPNSLWAPADYWIVVLPHWFLTILLALLPIAWIRHRFRLRRRAKPRQCRHCGYDLRFSADRCPECGAPIGSNLAATASA